MEKLIEEYFAGELNSDERIELLRRLESEKELRDDFIRCQNIQASLSFSDDVIDPEESRKKYQSFLSNVKKQKVRRIILRFLSYAAAVIALTTVVHLYHVYNASYNLQTITETTLTVPAGQRISITLQDGTIVWLNAQSRLTYPSVFVGSERRISLEGEGYFEVAYNKEKPFIVSSGRAEMKVLGTSFNINSYPQEEFSRISLIEGSLEVYDPLAKSSGIILQPNQEVTIRDGEMYLASIPHADYFLWKEGIYSFNDERFDVILKKLELYYDIRIIVEDTNLLEGRYTVKFRQRDGIDEIIRLMQKVHSFHIQKDEENNRIVIK